MEMLKKIMVLSFVCCVMPIMGHEIQNNTPFTLVVRMCEEGDNCTNDYTVGPHSTINALSYLKDSNNPLGIPYRILRYAAILRIEGKQLPQPLVIYRAIGNIGEEKKNKVVGINFDALMALGGITSKTDNAESQPWSAGSQSQPR